jgi:hypothetical protein
MHNQTPQKMPGKPKQQPVPPELSDPPGRKVQAIFICRCNGCGTTNVNYADTNEPSSCRNKRCSGVVSDGGPRWLRSQIGDSAVDPRTQQPPPPTLGRVPQVPMPPPPEEPPFVDIKAPPETAPPETRRMTAAEYRSEWVSERVAAWADKPAIDMGTRNASAVWDVMEALYDEGRKRGHLP